MVYSVAKSNQLRKCRVLEEFAHQLGKRIAENLLTIEAEIQYMPRRDVLKAKGKCAKMKTDYKHMQMSFKSLNHQLKRKENFFKAQEFDAPPTERHNSDISKNIQNRNEVEYDNSMRMEHDKEVRVINQQMHKVNDIFKDLSQIVNDQQDQIDEIGFAMDENNEVSKSSHKIIKDANDKKSFFSGNGNMSPKSVDVNNIDTNGCSFFLPLERQLEPYINVKSVHKDLMEFGSDMMEVGHHTYQTARLCIMSHILR